MTAKPEQSAGREGRDVTPGIATVTEPIAFVVRRHLNKLPAKTNDPLPVLLGAIAGTVLFQVVVVKLGLGPAVLSVIAGIALIAIVAFLTRRTETREDAAENVEFPPAPDDARLKVTGSRKELAPLTRLCDIAFEPAIFERMYANTSLVWIFGLGILFGVALEILLKRIIPIMPAGVAGGLNYILGIEVAWLATRVRPTYYRVVPGSLDIMRFAPLTNRARILRRWNLRSARIRIAIDQQRVNIADGGEVESIRLFGVSEPYKFVEALVQGAISTYPAPPLPNDQLLG